VTRLEGEGKLLRVFMASDTWHGKPLYAYRGSLPTSSGK
jgi:hypothetical protein